MVDVDVPREPLRSLDGGGEESKGAALRALLDRLAAEAMSVSIADYEPESAGPLEPVFSHVERVLGQASDAFLTVVEHYEALETQRMSQHPPIEVASLMTSIDHVVEGHDGIGRVVSIAFIGRIGVRERAASLRGARTSDRWESVDLLGSALREVVKACSALDLSICELEGLPAERNYFVSEVQCSLDTRRAYVRLRQEVAGASDPAPHEVVGRLRKAAASIAKLVGRPIYSHLRTRDRHQIRRLQERVAHYLSSLGSAALGGQVDDFVARDGIRLFRDLVNLTELMMQVNHRAELRGYDATLASSIAAGLANGLDASTALTQLAPMLGRSRELDAMFEYAKDADAKGLRALLLHIVDDVDADGSVRRSFVMPSRLGSGA